ncbi:MAG: hypothetical protein ACI9XU_001798 [Arenicella sp.]|jgi:hypothetical protein
MKNQPDWWDPYSCQPYKMRDEDKPRGGLANVVEYTKVAASNLLGLPAIACQYLALSKSPANIPASDFVGLSVMPDPEYQNAIEEMVEDLGVSQLLTRIPSWDTDALDDYVAFLERFPKQQFVINILQSRDSTKDVATWKNQVRKIISATAHITKVFWIGNAINRTKWGCAHTGEYFLLQEAVEELRSEFEGLTLLGSSVIDFEPLLTWRTLRNLRSYSLEANASLMYVNRRHSPYGTQYGIFDLENKLRLTKAMTRLSNRCADSLWITETNWPLLDTKPYTPNSGNPTRTVDEETQAKYLKWYYQIAWQTGWVDKVYWWQLINPGYGLVDHREGGLRKMPSYYALKQIIDGQLQSPPER